MFQRLLLVAVWAVLCLPNLGGPSLWDIDEGNNASCFREMMDSGNLIVPTFNFKLREDKPVLLYWLQIACAALVGVNEWADRLPSALASLLTLLTVHELGRRLFDARTGLWAALVLASSFAFLGAAHFANPDALLLAFSTLALALFWHDFHTAGRGTLVGVGCAAGLAVLAKGPVGLVLPAGVALLFLAWQRRLGYLWDRRVGWLLLALLLVAAPWYVLVTLETRGEWIAGFFKKHNVERMLHTMEGHSGPWAYYLPVLFAGLGPWAIFLIAAGWHAYRRLREGAEDRPAVRFLLVWFGLYFVFFSCAGTKLPNYILPAYPAVALLVGHLLERWRSGLVDLPAWLVRTALACLALGGVAVTVALLAAGGMIPVQALRGRVFPEALAWAPLGAVLVGGAVVAALLFERGARGGVLGAVAVTAVLFAAPLVGWGLAAIDPHKASRGLVASLPPDQQRRDLRLAAWDWFQPSVVFYSRREVERPNELHLVHTFLDQPLPAYLFVPESTWARLGRGGRVVGRHRDLYTGRVILVVANERAGG